MLSANARRQEIIPDIEPGGTNAGVCVRQLTESDLQSVTLVHAAAFPDSALTKLGAESVRRYYEWQLLGPHEVVALGAFVDNDLSGFCFGGLFKGSTSGFVSKNRVYLSWRVLTHPWLAANPMFRERLIIATRILKRFAKPKPSRSRTRPPARSANKSFGILSIAVDPQCQGLGLGRVLMEESESVARQRGFNQMDLTVHPNNHKAVHFYEGRGWEKESQRGVWQGLMRKSLVV
jgi:ribosomal protein S18 acetylase RimI-like enzyme